MKIPLIFHFNQHLSEFAHLASMVCYRGLLRVLLDSPAKANIHISGTLVQALKWFDPEPLKLIRTGLETGRFELLGSTHAQNILISTDDWDNSEQIKLHREILWETFGAEPTAFWNPERCWRQPLVGLLTDHGYTQVPVEDHILKRSGADARVVYRTAWEGRSIHVIRDDERFKHLFNFGAWFGKTERLHAYLDQVGAAEPEAVFAYGEDAEAMGLWGHRYHVLPEQTWDRLASMLQELHDRGDVETALFRELPEPAAALEQVAEGSAAWMDASLQYADLPYHEDGYENWFDFNRRAEKLSETRKKYTFIRDQIQQGPADHALARLARHALLTAQYEFGCIGIGGPNSRVWSGAISAISLMRMAAAQEGVHVEDWNLDGEDEVLVRHGDQVVVLTPTGGRVLYWADLGSGRLIVGNPGCVSPGMFAHEGMPPFAEIPRPNPRPENIDYTQYIRETLPPTEMRRFLPDWIWDPDPGKLELAIADLNTYGENGQALLAQQGAFLDVIRPEGPRPVREIRFERTGLDFQTRLSNGLTLEKNVQLTPSGPAATYRLNGKSDQPLEIHTSCEITGDYAENLRKGRAALEIIDADGLPAVRTASRTTIRLQSDLPGAEIEVREGFHALTLVHRARWAHLDGKAVSFTLRLMQSGR